MAEKNTFLNKIVTIQSTLNAPKDLYNKFGKFNYRSCESILAALKPLLKQEGLVQTISDEVVLIGERYYIKTTVRVTDGNETLQTEAYAREPQSKTGMDESQLTGSTSSYARKYALNGLWDIDDMRDSDGENNSKSSNHEAKTESSANDKELREITAQLLAAFGALSISQPMIESFLGKKISSIVEADITKLRKVYQNIKSGTHSADSFFGNSLNDLIRQ